MPEAKLFYIEIPSIHASNFFEELFSALSFVNAQQSPFKIKVIIEWDLHFHTL